MSSNTLPASVDSTLGVYFVPALTGLGAPGGDDSARGVICGLSRGVEARASDPCGAGVHHLSDSRTWWWRCVSMRSSP
ncbi:hypothetical protein RBI80_15905 [Klebsiella variicola]|nr:hypothetical protein RBI80_15905 [Klebsiella variicola]